MTSILKVDTIQTTAGDAPTTADLGITGAGTVLQEIHGICDGRTVSGVTFGNVTAIQNLTTSHVDLTGSSVSYTPPLGATTVVYTFAFHWDASLTSGISHFQFYIDGTSVDSGLGRRTHASAYQSNAHPVMRIVYEFPILIDSTLASDQINNLKLKSWTGAKTLKVSGRYYGSNYNSIIHQNVWFNGNNASTSDGPPATNVSVPTLSIKAIA
tara:strand:- start:217 stop:852 length:636 start_codon:yes stop_codon:yes gene_type:complete